MRLYFHGNCQLPALARLFREIRPDWAIHAREVHARETLKQEAETRADAASADVIVCQPIRRDYGGVDWLGLEGLQAMAKPGCRVVRIPSMFFDGQLPCWAYLGGGAGRLRGYRMSYHCLPVAAMVLRGESPETIIRRLLAPDFLDPEWSRGAFQRSVDELARREADGHVDVPVSDIYAELGRQAQVGHTINHPTRRVLLRVAERILRLLGQAADLPEAGPEYLPLPHLAVLPATQRALGLAPDQEPHYRLANRAVEPDAFLRLLVEHYQGLPAGALGTALRASREATSFFEGIAASHPGADWASLDAVASAPVPAPVQVPAPDVPAYTPRRAVLPFTIAGARIVAEVPSPWTRDDLGRLMLLDDPEEREAIGRIAPASRAEPYTPPPFRLVQLPDAVVLNFPRTEGMILDADGNFVRGSRGSPRILPENPFIRMEKAGEGRFLENPPIAGEIGRAFVGFCPASANYAHLMGLFVQRLMIANTRLEDTAFLFPDLPEYRTLSPGALRNEFMFRLPDLVPLTGGNFYRPLRAGAYRVRELLMLEPGGDRWGLMFQPQVRAGFDALAAEALRRARLSGTALPRRLYVSRQGAGRRRIANHDEFLAVVEAAGFETRRMEDLDFWDQAAHFAAADCVVTVHGAGCANLLFSRPGTALVEMYPKPLLSHQFVHTALSRDCRHFPLPCQPAGRAQSVLVDLGALRTVLDAALG
jgi:hypothetical protein